MAPRAPARNLPGAAVIAAAALLLIASPAIAHGVAEADKAFLTDNPGTHVGPFIYLGAKHMVTGYDHLLFLVGVIFFLHRLKDVAIYVSAFTVGHSTTLLLGVLGNVSMNAYIIDAIIGLSVVYKGFDNLGGFTRILGRQPNTLVATLVFGLFHGLGLATKLQEFQLSPDGLVANIVSFNVGVELGQLLALGMILIAMGWWRRSPSFTRHAFATNTLLMAGGFVLMGYQIVGYFVGAGA